MSKWITVAPVLENYNDILLDEIKKIKIDGITIERIPDWLKKENITQYLSYSNKKQMEDARCMFLCEYEAKSLGDPDISWKGDEKRGKQKTALEKIQISNLALWLAQPSPLAFDLVFHIDTKIKAVRHSFSTNPISHHQKDARNYHSKNDFKIANDISTTIQNLPRTDSLWLAVRTLFEALTNRSWEGRFLLLWIVLESLFGTSTEITYRISHRLGFFLTSTRKEASEIYDKVKNSYVWRSKIVHGMRHKLKQNESEIILYETERFARDALLKILSDKEIRNIFSGSTSNREQYLDNLIFEL